MSQQYADEFIQAQQIKLNDPDAQIKVVDDAVHNLALGMLAEIANHAMWAYAVIRDMIDSELPNVGPQSFTPSVVPDTD
jgi:hypothetical protein